MNIHLIGITEGQEREKGAEGLFKEIKLKTSQILEGTMTPRFMKLKGPPSKGNPKKTTIRHIIIKLSIVKYKRRILKEEKNDLPHKASPPLIRLSAVFLAETLQDTRV